MLKTPKFWKWQKNEKNDRNSRANFNKEGEWAYVHNDNCNSMKDCTMKCNKKDGLCKFFVMKTDMGIVKVKRLCNNARLPVRGSTGAAGYDLAAAQSAVVPAHGKLLVKTGLSLSMPTGCYGRIAPRSGLALKKFIDVGAGVIDEDYRGEIGVVLFNFGNDDFEVNMGDKVAQLIFEKIKTPKVVETDSLEETGRGDRGYGSTGIQSTEKEPRDQSTTQDSRSESEQSIKSKKQQISTINLDQNEKYMKQMKNEPVPHVLKSSQASKTRQIITARQIQKLAKQGQPVFLAIIRSTENVLQRRGRRGGNKQSPKYAAVAHGMTEGQKRKISKETGPKKIGLQWKSENNKFSTVFLKVIGKNWKQSFESFETFSQKNCPKNYQLNVRFNMRLKLNRAVSHPIGHHTDWVLLNRMSWKNRLKTSWLRASFDHLAVRTGHRCYLCLRKTADGGCVSTIGR